MAIAQNGKALLRGALRHRDLPRAPFVPLISSFAAKIEQIPVRDALSDPTLLSKSLSNAQALIGHDAVISVFDPALEAEACGCAIAWGDERALPRVVGHPLQAGATITDLDVDHIEKKGRIPVILEATKRMSLVIGKQVGVIGVVSGPLQLAGQLLGDAGHADDSEQPLASPDLVALCGKVMARLCRAYCDCGVDAILVMEDRLAQAPDDVLKAVGRELQTVRNIANFFNAGTLLLTGDWPVARLSALAGLQSDGFILGHRTDYLAARAALRARNRALGICVADFDPEGGAAGNVADVCGSDTKGILISTEGEVPFDTPVAAVRNLAQRFLTQ